MPTEATNVLITDVDEHERAPDARMRQAVAHSTAWWVTVTYGKRGQRRRIPLEAAALEAITAWVHARPTCGHDQLLISLPRTGQPPSPLGLRDVGRIVTDYATRAGLPDDRRFPHVLRHTFCTHLADSGVPVDVIRQLAGHVDIRTTMIYTGVNQTRLQDAIGHAAAQRTGLPARPQH